jgi:TatD DNase family protein
MLSPEKTDYIDIHTHQQNTDPDIFSVRCLLTHQPERPHDYPTSAVSVGAHPWFIEKDNLLTTLEDVAISATGSNVVAIGEAGLDKVKGAEMPTQITAFEKQAIIANNLLKPLIVHCVKAWDELLAVHRNINPRVPWIIHGFMGSKELAGQIIDKGMFISLWYSFALAERSASLIKWMPQDRLFLETDSSDANIKDIYAKVAGNLNISVDSLKSTIVGNYDELAPKKCQCCQGKCQ